MTGPLAQQIAQVRAGLEVGRRDSPLPGGWWDNRDAALSAIERHVQDTAEDVQQIVSALPGHPHGRDPVTYAKDVTRHVQDMETALRGLLVKWPDGECFCHVRGTDGGVDHMPGCAEARSALPASGTRNRVAREKGTERGCAACDGDPEAHGLHVCGREF